MCPLLLALLAHAETVTLEDALRRAQVASEDLEVAEADVEGARGDTMQATSGLLPTVTGSASYNHTFASEYDDLFADTGGTNPFGNLPFGRRDTYRVGVSLAQPIWAGGSTRAAMRVAASGRALADLGVDAAKATVALATAQAWYDAALADRLLDVAKQAQAQAETTLAHAQAAVEAGKQPEFELLRARVEVENQKVVVIQQERIRTIAHLRLAQLLDVEDVELAGELDAEADVAGVAAQVAGVKGDDRAVVAQAEESVRLAEATLAATRAQGYPQVAASADYGLVDYPDTVLPDADWRTNLTAGVGVSVPIFAGLRVRGAVVSARADVDAAKARLDEVRELADLDARDAKASLDAADAQWRATAGAVDEAQRAYAIAEVRFAEGLSTQSELTDARLLLERAQANRAQAARDLQLARIRLALLPALPLSTS